MAVADARVDLDPALVGECGTWSLSAGHTSGAVNLVAAPTVDGAATLGMSSDATTRVEGGTETRSHADTFIAYLGEYVTYVTVVTDPGAVGPRCLTRNSRRGCSPRRCRRCVADGRRRAAR